MMYSCPILRVNLPMISRQYNILRAMVWFGYEAPSAAQIADQIRMHLALVASLKKVDTIPLHRTRVISGAKCFFGAHSCVDPSCIWIIISLASDISTGVTFLYNRYPQITNCMASL